MPKFVKQLKAWLPPLTGLSLVFISAGYAWSLKTTAAREIDQLHELGASLDTAVEDVRAATLSSEDARELEIMEADLRQRMEDVKKPALVQAELMAAARRDRLEVREIQPITAAKAAGAEAPTYLNYRVSVMGSYRQVAEYMQLCKTHRLPVRVIGLRMSRQLQENGRLADRLTADITIETFQPPEAAKQGA